MIEPARRHVLTAAILTPFVGAYAAAPAVASPPTVAQWRRLDTAMAGDVLLPGDTAYAGAKQLFAPRYDVLRPLAVVRPATTADVATAVKFARAHDLRVTARAGGHSYTGRSSGDALMVLDLRKLAGIQLAGAGATAVLGAGTTLYNVHAKLVTSGRTITTGTCPTVGTTGLALGGGLGPDDHRYGLTADSVTGATMVLMDGRTVTVSNSQPDLLWALRGGGGQLGIVTQLRMATHAASSRGYLDLAFPGSAAQAVIAAWAAYQPAASAGTWVRAQITRSAAGGVRGQLLGVTDAGMQNRVAQDLIDAVGVAPLSRTVKQLTHLQLVTTLGNGTTTPRRDNDHGSDVLTEVSSTTAAGIVAAMESSPGTGGGCVVQLSPLGGGIAARTPAGTPFPYRRHIGAVQWVTGLPSGATAADFAAARAWIDAAHAQVSAASVGGYVNYVEPGQPAARYFGANLTRLRSLKTTYDPEGRLLAAVDL